MKQHFIFGRTEAGESALSGASGTLEARLRRFLLLVDGKRCIAELETVARPSELIATLEELVDAGLVCKVGENGMVMSGVGEAESDPFAAAAMTPDMFARLKRRAIADLDQRYGPAAASIAQRINASSTPADLRVALRASGADLIAVMGAGAAQEFLQGLGRNLVA